MISNIDTPNSTAGAGSSPSSCSQVCRVCGGKLKTGIALIPGIYGSEDFGGDFWQTGTTMSEGPGDGKPRQCLKCETCGHSFIPANDKALPQAGRNQHRNYERLTPAS